MAERDKYENYEVLHHPDGSLHELGRGSMGVTYKAWDAQLHCFVALKVVSPAVLEGPGARESFLEEARTAARLRHPNIAGVFRLGSAEDGTLYYAMEYCEGRTLESEIAQEGTLSPVRALGIAVQVCKALAVAERESFVHRDLKPANLILTESVDEGLVVKVIDFGLAQRFGDGRSNLSSRNTTGFAGTAHFASPEQLEESKLDSRSDIFSLGICLWFMLTGRPPFEGSPARVMSQTLSSEFPWDRLTGQPAAVVAVLRHMLEKRADLRPATIADLRSELEACMLVLEAAPAPSETQVVAEESLSFSERFEVGGTINRSALGTAYRGWDRLHGGKEVRLLHVEASLTAVPANRRELEEQSRRLMKFPQGNLLVPSDFVVLNQDVWVAFPPVSGCSLFELLKHRGSLSAQEVSLLLPSFAAVADHAMAHGLQGVNFAWDRVYLCLSKGAVVGNLPGLVSAPLSEWPECCVKVEAISMDGDGHAVGGAEMHAMQTLIGSSSTFQAEESLLPSLGNLVCGLLGGRGGKDFVPLARLGEEANAVLKRAFSSPRSFSSAGAFGREFLDALAGAPAASVPRRATQTPPPARTTASATPAPPAIPPLPLLDPGSVRGKKSSSGGFRLVVPILAAGVLIGIPIAYENFWKESPDSRTKAKASLSSTSAAKEKSPPKGQGTDAAYFHSQSAPPSKSEWRELAGKGDAFVQAILGESLIFSPGATSQQIAEGREWVEKSAAKKHPLGVFLAAEQEWLDVKSPSPGRMPDELLSRFRAAIENGFEDGAADGGAAWRSAVGRARLRGLGMLANTEAAVIDLKSAAIAGHIFSQYLMGEISEKNSLPALSRQTAAGWYELAAEGGWPQAREAIGRLCGLGAVSFRDPAAALAWAAAAAKAGDPVGQLVTGLFNEAGVGTPVDVPRAFAFYQMAAGKGNAAAMGHMARLYLGGLMESPGDGDVLDLLRKAVDGGSLAASSDLGKMYESGRAGAAEPERAVEIYRKGVDAGDLRSFCPLAACAEQGRGMAQRIELAVDLYSQAANAGVVQGMYELGMARLKGRGTRKEETAGAKWIEMAAEGGWPMARLEWARCLEKAIGTAENETDALEWYRKAAMTGMPEADFRMGVILERGRDVSKNLDEAMKHYLAAAKSGYAPAQVNLGLMYARGEGCTMDEKRAVDYYTRAAGKSDVDAMVLLAMMKEFGRGTPRDVAAASALYRKAADLGDQDASNRYKQLTQ